MGVNCHKANLNIYFQDERTKDVIKDITYKNQNLRHSDVTIILCHFRIRYHNPPQSTKLEYNLADTLEF